MNTTTFLTSQEIKDRLFLFNLTNDYSYVTNVHPLQQVNFMYPSVVSPMDIMLEKDPVIQQRKREEYLTALFNPSEDAIKILADYKQL